MVLHLPVISVVTQRAGAVASRGRKSDGQLNPHTTTGHANPKPANPAFYSSLQIAAKYEMRPKKVQKLPLRYKCGKLVRSGETGVGAPVTPRRTCWPFGQVSELLRCFNPPAAAGRNSRAAPVTAKTSTGDDHRSVGDRHLARADVAPSKKSFGNLRTGGEKTSWTCPPAG